jgi:hypothetical protein
MGNKHDSRSLAPLIVGAVGTLVLLGITVYDLLRGAIQ